MENQARLYQIGDLTLDGPARTLRRGQDRVPLSPKEFDTLLLLAAAEGRAVSREHLIARVWPGVTVTDNSLSRCISGLRKALGPNAIEVVPKFGYRLALPQDIPLTATPAEQPPAPPLPPPDPAPQPSFARRWWTAAALFLLAIIGVAGLLAAKSPLVWTDPQTGLTWQRTDNGHDVDHDEAVAYCSSLSVSGHNDWRLPDMEELQTLADPTQSRPGKWGGVRPVYWHVKGSLQLSGGETARDLTWLTEQTPAGLEQTFDFSYGRRNYNPITFRSDHRALCVRSNP